MNGVPSKPSEPVCRRVIYSGHVQGVGFRYTVASIAKGRPVRGFVRNLPNGTVELLAEAKPDDLERFLKRVADAFAGQIERCEMTEVCPPEPFAAFEIRG